MTAEPSWIWLDEEALDLGGRTPLLRAADDGLRVALYALEPGWAVDFDWDPAGSYGYLEDPARFEEFARQFCAGITGRAMTMVPLSAASAEPAAQAEGQAEAPAA